MRAGVLKRVAGDSDPESMAGEPSCPVCDADLVFGGDEKAGDLVVCSFCGASFVVSRGATKEEAWEVEEDD